MKKTTLVCMLSAGLALLPVAGAFCAAPNPTPTRQSKLLVDFESDTNVTSDPTGAGESRASVNTDAEFVAAVEEATGRRAPTFEPRAILDQPAALQTDVDRVLASPLVPDGVVVAGLLYDLRAGRLTTVVPPRTVS